MAGCPPPPMAFLMDIRLIEVSKGRAVFRGNPQEFHYNTLGSVHGGYGATMLDSAMGCAVHTMLDAGDLYTTLEFKINFLRAMTNRDRRGARHRHHRPRRPHDRDRRRTHRGCGRQTLRVRDHDVPNKKGRNRRGPGP